MGIKRKTKIRLIKRKKIKLLKKIKILQHQLNSILRKSLILKIRVFKDKKLIAMRHNSATISTGEWHLLAADSDQVYAFTRTNGDDTILVVVNLTDRSAALPSDVAELLSDGVSDPQVLLSTYDAMHSVKSIARGELARWEGVVIQL